MKKVLILCDLFPPAFGPRMGYLCKYLQRAGWKPVVITEQIHDSMFSFLKGDTAVTYISYYRFNKKGILGKLEWIWIQLLDLLFHYKDRKMAEAAIRMTEKESFDILLCSSFRAFPLPAARKVAQTCKLPLVVDLRDIIEQYAGDEYIDYSFKHKNLFTMGITRLFRQKFLCDRNKALAQAAHVTTISPWHVEQLRRFNPDTSLIYNGYDPELFYPELQKTDQFIITYTGRIISLAVRDPHLLFEAVEELHKTGQISPDKFRIRWYMDKQSQQLVREASASCCIADYMDYLDFVSADKVPALLNGSSVLLQLANTFASDGPKGFMTTKLFEALATERPILCVRSDESYLEETIRKTKTGIAARTKEEALHFISTQYKYWLKAGYTQTEPDKKEIEKFSRKSQAEQFMTIFDTLIKD